MVKLKLKRSDHGFTLIEVLVAITIIVAAFSVIFPVMNQSRIQTSRVNDVLNNSVVQESILNEISVVNVFEKQSGANNLGNNISYTWEAIPESSVLDVRGDTGQKVQLFTVNVNYEYKNVEHKFSFEQLGWHG